METTVIVVMTVIMVEIIRTMVIMMVMVVLCGDDGEDLRRYVLHVIFYYFDISLFVITTMSLYQESHTADRHWQQRTWVPAHWLSRVWFSATPWTVAHRAPLSMEFSRQESWSGLPFPIPGDLPKPGIKPTSPASPVLAGRFFTTEPPGKPMTRASQPFCG